MERVISSLCGALLFRTDIIRSRFFFFKNCLTFISITSFFPFHLSAASVIAATLRVAIVIPLFDRNNNKAPVLISYLLYDEIKQQLTWGCAQSLISAGIL